MQNLGHVTKVINICNRKFILHILKLDNGCFIIISENSEKIGSMLAAISTKIPTTVSIIPDKNDPFFSQLLSKRVSSTINGICITSVYLLKKLNTEIVKILITDIMKIIKNV